MLGDKLEVMKKIIFYFISSIIFLTLNSFSYAQSSAPTVSGGRGVTVPSLCPGTEVPTALGCIPSDPAELAKWILSSAIYAGGGIAFLISVWGGIGIVLSAGNPEGINKNKEMITSALSGLLFIIFSVFILRLVGYDILKLPKFTL